MDTTTLVVSTIAILTQTASILKSTKSLLKEYGPDLKAVGEKFWVTVRKKFSKTDETAGEIDYFLIDPQQKKRQQIILDSLTQFVESDLEFRAELENLLQQYESLAPSDVKNELHEMVRINTEIGGNVKNSRIYSAGRDVHATGK